MIRISNLQRDEMSSLHFQDGWSLQRIGDKFGVSRQRVQQVIGNSNGARNAMAENFVYNVDPSKTTDEMLQEIKNHPLRIHSKVLNKIRHSRHAVVGGNNAVQIGDKGENLVSDKLNSLGIQNKLMPLHHPFDILLDNGIRIDVKTTSKTWRGYYRFGVRKSVKKDCDFFIFLAIKENVFWVIPFTSLRDSATAYINSEEKRYITTYSTNLAEDLNKYRDRFDILK